MTIAFVLLVQIHASFSMDGYPTIDTLNLNHALPNLFECTDGHVEKCRWEAVLFRNKHQLDEYTREHDVTGDRLVDTHAGTVRTLRSKAVMHTVAVKPTEEIDHYETQVEK